MHEQEWYGARDVALLVQEVDRDWFKAADSDLGLELRKFVEFLFLSSPAEPGFPMVL